MGTCGALRGATHAGLGGRGTAAELGDGMIAELDSADLARWSAAGDGLAGRFEAEGWPWAIRHLQAAGSWPATRASGFLLGLPSKGAAFDWADQLGGEVRAVTGRACIRTPSQTTATGYAPPESFVKCGRAVSALDTLTLTVRHGGGADPGLIADALAQATPSPDLRGNDLVMFAYNVTSLLDYLGNQPDADRHQLAMLEWRYLPVLESRQRPAKFLHQEMARSPEFFAEVISMVFRAEHQAQPSQVNEEERHKAILAYQLLRSWSTVPGSAELGSGADLAQWVTEARALLTRGGRLRPRGPVHRPRPEPDPRGPRWHVARTARTGDHRGDPQSGHRAGDRHCHLQWSRRNLAWHEHRRPARTRARGQVIRPTRSAPVPSGRVLAACSRRWPKTGTAVPARKTQLAATREDFWS